MADYELIDIYDQNGQPTGETIQREGAFLKEGQYMRYVLALMRNRSGRYLITQRALDKHWAPGAWEVPGGGVVSGETSAQAVVREVREEVGLDVSHERLSPLWSYTNEDLPRGDNYLVDIYLFDLDFSLEDVHLQRSEAIDVQLATWDDMEALADGNQFLHFARLSQALEETEDQD